MPKNRVIPSPWLTPSRVTYNIVDPAGPLLTSGDRPSDDMPKVLSYQPTGKPLRALALVWATNF